MINAVRLSFDQLHYVFLEPLLITLVEDLDKLDVIMVTLFDVELGRVLPVEVLLEVCDDPLDFVLDGTLDRLGEVNKDDEVRVVVELLGGLDVMVIVRVMVIGPVGVLIERTVEVIVVSVSVKVQVKVRVLFVPVQFIGL